MAVINSTSALTLLEIAKRTAPDGSYLGMANVLSKTNEILQDMPFFEANGGTFHKYTRVASEPTGQDRKLNEGVETESSTSVEEAAGVCLTEAYSEIDMRLLNINKNPEAYRNNEALRFVSGMGKRMATKMFYSTKATAPTTFNGLAPLLNSTTSENGYVVKNGETSGTGTSLYIATWGAGQVYGIYPTGSIVGLQHKDLGEQTRRYWDSSASKHKNMQVMVDHFMFDAGIVVEDPRFIGRLANINTTVGDENSLDPKKLISLINQIQEINANTYMYVNRSLKAQLDVLAYDKANGFYTAQNIFGEPVTMFRGIPVRLCEGIVENEALVS